MRPDTNGKIKEVSVGLLVGKNRAPGLVCTNSLVILSVTVTSYWIVAPVTGGETASHLQVAYPHILAPVVGPGAARCLISCCF